MLMAQRVSLATGRLSAADPSGRVLIVRCHHRRSAAPVPANGGPVVFCGVDLSAVPVPDLHGETLAQLVRQDSVGMSVCPTKSRRTHLGVPVCRRKADGRPMPVRQPHGPRHGGEPVLDPRMDGALETPGDVSLTVRQVRIVSTAPAIPAGPTMCQSLTTAKAGYVRPSAYAVLFIPRPNVAPCWVLGVGDFSIAHFSPWAGNRMLYLPHDSGNILTLRAYFCSVS